MASEGLTDSHTPPPRPGQAKAYNRIKLATSLASTTLSLGLLVALIATGWSRIIAALCISLARNEYAELVLFALCLGAIQSLVNLPLSWYSSFHLEHKYALSNQSFRRWIWERTKGLAVSAPLMLGVLCVLYYCLKAYGATWWLPVSIVLTLLSVVLARLAPVLIMPLFYRFTPIAEGTLKARIMQLCREAGVRIDGIFSFNLSKNTKKANAAFTGIGRAKRIILGDTLVKEFSEEEIETVFAHELGHYRFGHIRTGIAVGMLLTFIGLFLAGRLYEWSVYAAGFASRTDLAGLPLLAIWLSLLGLATSPIGNVISRHHERQADTYAVRSTGKRDAFVSALRKLSALNLADPEPHALVEFLFYSHPPIAKRIRTLEQGRS